MSNISISVKDDFNRRPGLRTHTITPGNSGEDFYHKVLNAKFYEAYSQGGKLTVNLDDTAGYPPSFIDESFGRLTYDFGADIVKSTLIIISNDEEIWKSTIFDSVLSKWQKRRTNNEYPKMSEGFSPSLWWHRSSEGEFKQITSYDGN